MQSAYGYHEGHEHVVTVGKKKREKSFKKSDQFAAEIVYFSKCIARDLEPEPDGEEGLMDVRILRAISESVKTGRSVRPEATEEGTAPDHEARDAHAAGVDAQAHGRTRACRALSVHALNVARPFAKPALNVARRFAEPALTVARLLRSMIIRSNSSRTKESCHAWNHWIRDHRVCACDRLPQHAARGQPERAERNDDERHIHV